MREGGDPTLTGCILRDHAYEEDGERGCGCGVYVASSAYGTVTVGADCVFARNDEGDIVGPTRCARGGREGEGEGGVGRLAQLRFHARGGRAS